MKTPKFNAAQRMFFSLYILSLTLVASLGMQEGYPRSLAVIQLSAISIASLIWVHLIWERFSWDYRQYFCDGIIYYTRHRVGRWQIQHAGFLGDECSVMQRATRRTH